MDDAKYRFPLAMLGIVLFAVGCSTMMPDDHSRGVRSYHLSSASPDNLELGSPDDPFTRHLLARQAIPTDPFPIVRDISEAAVSNEEPSPAPEKNIRQVSYVAPSRPAPVRETESFSEQGEGDEEDEDLKEDDGIPLARQEEILSQDLWTPNLELQRLIDHGTRDTDLKQDAAELKRMANRIRQNMSDKEVRQQRENVFEYSAGLCSTWRWFFKDFEELAKTPFDKRDSPIVFLQEEKYRGKSHKILRANAAILLGRDGDADAAPLLLAIVRDEKMGLNLRCAAAETLGKLPQVPARELISLIDLVKEREVEEIHPRTGLTVKTLNPGVHKLWTELLTAIAEKIAPWEHHCFMEPFYARGYEIRLETAKIWRRYPPPPGVLEEGKKYVPLPDEFVEYVRQETSPGVRAELIRTLGLWRDPDILSLVRSDLNQKTALRYAAMDALADAGCREAVPLIKEKLRDNVGRNRAKAVQTLRKLGCYDLVFDQANDSSWEVRVEVAHAIADLRSPQTFRLAKQNLSGTSEKVQQATLEAVRNWPFEEHAPLYLEALKSRNQSIRLRAVALLAPNLPEVKKYNPLDLPENQVKQHSILVERFQDHLLSLDLDPEQFEIHTTPLETTAGAKSEVTADDPLLAVIRRCLDEWSQSDMTPRRRAEIRDNLLRHKDRLLPLLEHLFHAERKKIPDSLDAVLVEADPVFAELARLESEDLGERRRAARELFQLSEHRSFGKFCSRRIVERARNQDDPLVVGPLLKTLLNADPEAACRLATELFDSETVDLKRQACAVLGQAGTPEDLPSLIDLFSDSRRTLAAESIDAAGEILRRYPDSGADLYHLDEALEKILLSGDTRLQADAATVLCRTENTRGPETLRRLSQSGDAKLRFYVVQKIVSLEMPEFAKLLIRLLDDHNGSVRSAALDGLPKLIGDDIGSDENMLPAKGELSGTQLKIARWKNWAKKDGSERY